MVGYDLEDKAYCMELTFNYGLDSYKAGTGLKEFGLFVQDVEAAVAAAKGLGYAVQDGVITGPDDYNFRPLPLPAGRGEKFLYVLCRVRDVAVSSKFYRDFLGMSDAAVPSLPSMPAKAAAVSYTPATHPHKGEPVLLVFYEDGTAPALTPWEGRHAFALSAEEVKAAYSKYKSERPDLIMHDGGGGEPLALQEKLGTLFIFIARDADGYELCLVSRETMLPAVVEAVTNYDGSALDWGARDKRIQEIAAAGQEVEATIKQHPVVLFSKEWCPFCKKAKEALSSVDAAFFAMELEDKKKAPLVASPAAFQDYLAAKTNVGRSVPKAFIGGSFVGGGDDVVAMMKSGQLLTKCVAVGAAKDTSAKASASGTHYFANGTSVTLEEWKRNKL